MKKMKSAKSAFGAAVFSALMIVAGAAHAAGQRPEVGPQVSAYAGTEGLKVWVVRVGPRQANEALVQVGGIDHDWNMKIQKMASQEVNGQRRYSLTVNGQKFVALILGGHGHGTLYLPGTRDERSVSYSEALSEQGNAEAFLTDYLNQPKAAR